MSQAIVFLIGKTIENTLRNHQQRESRHQAGAKEKISKLAPGSFVREAESADTITGTFQIENDEIASGGKFVWVPKAGMYDEGRDVIYNINIPKAGVYKIIARVFAPDYGSDSFYLKFDESEDYYTWDPYVIPEWNWQVVMSRPLGSTGGGSHRWNNPVSFPLSAGKRQFTLRAREDETQIDVLVFYRLQ